MTIENKILRDLTAGQSSPSATADRLRIHPQAAETILARLHKQGRLDHILINHTISVYRLTPETRQSLADQTAVTA